MLSISAQPLIRRLTSITLVTMISPDDAPFQLRQPLPALWREDGVLQLGCDDNAFALERVPSSAARLVEILAEPHTRAELVAQLPELGPHWVDWLCANLSSAGLLKQPESPFPRSVTLWGAGRLARHVATCVSEAGLHVRSAAGVRPIPGAEELIVIVDDHWEPDRALTTQLSSDGIPHLVVRVQATRAIVGPLVVPGRSGCVRCADLARSHTDPRWPHLLVQLCSTPSRPQALLLTWAAVTAAAQARAWIDGCEVELEGRTLELSLTDFRLRSREIPRRSDCGCGAFAA